MGIDSARISPDAHGVPTARPRRTLARVGLAAGIFIVGSLVILGGFEAWVRVTQSRIIREDEGPRFGPVQHDPRFVVEYTSRGRRLVPGSRVLVVNHFLSHRDIPLHINSHGFRSEELAVSKPADEVRVLVLGDSITLADYLPVEEGYVQRAEAYVRETLPESHVQLVNAGLQDVGLKEEINLLEDRGLAVEPDLVVLAYYLNDIRPPWGFAGELGHRGWLRRHSLLAETLYANAVLRGWLAKQGVSRFRWGGALHTVDWARDPAAFRQVVAAANYDWGAGWAPEAGAVIRRELGRLRVHADAHGFPVAIVTWPVVYQLTSFHLDDAPQRLMAEIAADLGFAHLDLLPVLRQAYTPDMYFDQCHPTPFGNDVAGHALADFLATEFRTLLDPPGAGAATSAGPSA